MKIAPTTKKAVRGEAVRAGSNFTPTAPAAHTRIIASAVRVIKIVVLCIVAVAPPACVYLAGIPATNCAAGCSDV